ncbi:MAG TPA: hypothetical protein VE966_12865 [Gemmatimonadales bacterium]|nr:hypothetical protein [Gemmatimonadales bacterium]
MRRWPSIADGGAMALVAVLCVAAATPLAAQQASGSAPPAAVGAAQASSASVTLPGPRLRPEWQRVEPSFVGSSTSAPMAASGGTHTVTVTTLVLVLVVIIAVLLIAK